VRKNYEAIETAKTEMLVAREKEKVTKVEEETKLLKAKMEAQRESEVAAINAQKLANVQVIQAQMLIKEKEAEKKTREIEAEIELIRSKSLTDAYTYDTTKRSEANRLLFTPEYLKSLLLTSIANNTKIFFGEKIPSLFSMSLLDELK